MLLLEIQNNLKHIPKDKQKYLIYLIELSYFRKFRIRLLEDIEWVYRSNSIHPQNKVTKINCIRRESNRSEYLKITGNILDRFLDKPLESIRNHVLFDTEPCLGELKNEQILDFNYSATEESLIIKKLEIPKEKLEALKAKFADKFKNVRKL